MPLDRSQLIRIFEALGSALEEPTTLCLIGSTPSIASGQPERQTADIDVWRPKSDYDAADLGRASAVAGVLFDPKDELDPNAVYIQIVRPGIVALPVEFEVEPIDRYGRLTIGMAPPAILVAAKLVRASETDLADAVWWMRERNLTLADIRQAVEAIPDTRLREAGQENLVLLQLVAENR
jgi:hypothetical protein